MKKRSLTGKTAFFCCAILLVTLFGACKKSNPGKPKSVYQTIASNSNGINITQNPPTAPPSKADCCMQLAQGSKSLLIKGQDFS